MWSTLLAHGDGLGDGDLGYRILRRVLRSRMAVTGFRWLHPDLGAGLARRVSRTERRALDERPDYARARNEVLRAWARTRLQEDPSLDLVAFGHTHLPDRTEVDENRWILNTGDWVYRRTYTVLEAGVPPGIRAWEADGDAAP